MDRSWNKTTGSQITTLACSSYPPASPPGNTPTVCFGSAGPWAILGGMSYVRVLLITAIAAPAAYSQGSASRPSESAYLEVVRRFADTVLAEGRDVYGPQRSPLLVDGLNVDTREPAVWVLPEDCASIWGQPRRSVLSNLASQQHFFRVLEALTALTGEAKYRQAAEEVNRYALTNLRFTDGLLYWGGHCAVDLETGQAIGEGHKDWMQKPPTPIKAFWPVGVEHELKYHFPFYELMWRVDREATRRFIEAFWAAHVQDWASLDMNRHGLYGVNAGTGWDYPFVGGPVPFKGKGLSLIHTGSDMIYAAVFLWKQSGDARPLAWACRMAGRYDQIRHPLTGLGPEMYNYYRNERVLTQFGPEYGDKVTETTIAAIYAGRYSQAQACYLTLYRQHGEPLRPLAELALADLRAFARYAYDPQTNAFRAMLTDGTPMSPERVPRPGAISPDTFEPRSAGPVQLRTYVLGWQVGRDELLWATARSVAGHLGVGDLGEAPGGEPALKPCPARVSEDLLLAVLELHQATGRAAYLEQARRIGDRLVAEQFNKGLFTASPSHLFARTGSLTPLALLKLHARLAGREQDVPEDYHGHPYYHNDWEGVGRTYDGQTIYARTRPAD